MSLFYSQIEEFGKTLQEMIHANQKDAWQLMMCISESANQGILCTNQETGQNIGVCTGKANMLSERGGLKVTIVGCWVHPDYRGHNIALELSCQFVHLFPETVEAFNENMELVESPVLVEIEATTKRGLKAANKVKAAIGERVTVIDHSGLVPDDINDMLSLLGRLS